MIKNIFSIYDSKADAFTPPFFMFTTNEAIRAFTDTVNGDNPIAQHPEDYTLFHLGIWDDQDSMFDIMKTPHSLGLAIEFVKQLPLPDMLTPQSGI